MDPNETRKEQNPYSEYDGKFCKVLIDNSGMIKPLKGFVKIVTKDILQVKGDFIETTLHINQIRLITTKLKGDQNDNSRE